MNAEERMAREVRWMMGIGFPLAAILVLAAFGTPVCAEHMGLPAAVGRAVKGLLLATAALPGGLAGIALWLRIGVWWNTIWHPDAHRKDVEP